MNKMVISRICSFILLAIMSVQASSEGCSNSGCTSKIKTIYTKANGNIYIGTPFDEKLANCTPVSGVYFELKKDATNFSEIYSSVLSAYFSKTSIQLRVVEGSDRCDIAYVRLDSDY